MGLPVDSGSSRGGEIGTEKAFEPQWQDPV